ncbi:NAD(P)-binding domain-containing protein [Sphingomonas aliaeris]|uniref:NAD(P)-binding domain-containing protein n=1 Tax=Sphingomonas aliaeris TaxID=2759526 RepID=A0A974NXF4_9SPHN|nr:NAD(P)-binding domain-containing protein [Sphingomonas aliaeris]QQV78577.1 NAD(P)-binding domain-containing protein [Sphingomonas aliaeris]
MKIGILGSGNIATTLVRTFSKAGHDVKVGNSRGPDTIDPALLSFGARATTSAEAVVGMDVVILSIPFGKIPDVAPLLSALPDNVVVIDTSNYYPERDGRIEAVEAGQVESLWVAEQIGRPIAKAWNAIGTDALAHKAVPAGAPGRIALPVAADRDGDRQVAMALVEDTGLDAVDAGDLAGSWRQQPGAPAYCTNLTRDEIAGALASAERARLPRRRDLAIAVLTERMEGAAVEPDPEFLPRLNRILYM